MCLLALTSKESSSFSEDVMQAQAVREKISVDSNQVK